MLDRAARSLNFLRVYGREQRLSERSTASTTAAMGLAIRASEPTGTRMKNMAGNKKKAT
jgi:hypothetical protein